MKYISGLYILLLRNKITVSFASITFNGKYNNTGFFLKAKDENENHIAFYSSDWSNASQRPKLTVSYTMGTFALEDINQDGKVNKTDLDIIWDSISTNIYCQRCDINNNNEVEVYDWVMVSGNSV
jgi:hypothetical protein